MKINFFAMRLKFFIFGLLIVFFFVGLLKKFLPIIFSFLVFLLFLIPLYSSPLYAYDEVVPCQYIQMGCMSLEPSFCVPLYSAAMGQNGCGVWGGYQCVWFRWVENSSGGVTSYGYESFSGACFNCTLGCEGSGGSCDHATGQCGNNGNPELDCKSGICIDCPSACLASGGGCSVAGVCVTCPVACLNAGSGCTQTVGRCDLRCIPPYVYNYDFGVCVGQGRDVQISSEAVRYKQKYGVEGRKRFFGRGGYEKKE